MEVGYIIFFGIYAFIIIIMSVGLSFTSTFGNHSSKWKTDEDGSIGEVPIELKLIRAFHEFLYYTGNFAIALGLWKGIWNGAWLFGILIFGVGVIIRLGGFGVNLLYDSVNKKLPLPDQKEGPASSEEQPLSEPEISELPPVQLPFTTAYVDEEPPQRVQPVQEPPPPSVAAPTPIQLPASPTVGELANLDPNLLDVLELCSVYLVALDEQFTPIEQDWVDAKFGPGSADKFIQIMSTIDWGKCFDDIYNKLLLLGPDSKLYMLTQAPKLFQDLLESDGLEDLEQERLIGLIRFINESLNTSGT